MRDDECFVLLLTAATKKVLCLRNREIQLSSGSSCRSSISASASSVAALSRRRRKWVGQGLGQGMTAVRGYTLRSMSS